MTSIKPPVSPMDYLREIAHSTHGDARANAYLGMVRSYIRGQGNARSEVPVITPEHIIELLADADRIFQRWLSPLHTSAAEVIGAPPDSIARALNYMHHESSKLTMSTDALLDNVVDLMRVSLDEGVPGDFIETGAWRGGVTILMRAVLHAFGRSAADAKRCVWVADSFAGLPAPDPQCDLRDAICHHLMHAVDDLRSDLESVRQAFARVGLLDERVHFLPGLFKETLPTAPIERIALLRLDGDWYDSTRDAIEALYPRVSPGGFVIVDDYGLPTGCARAIDEYRARHGIDAPLNAVGGQAVWWRKP